MKLSLSYSKYVLYTLCPAKFKGTHIDKTVKGAPSGAMSRGSLIHNDVEAFLKGESEALHPDIAEFYTDYFRMLRDMGAIPEMKIAVDRDWKVMDWDGDTYVRSVVDIVMPINSDGVLNAFELKTGKVYPDHIYQRELYSVKLKCVYPEAEEVRVTGVYLDLRVNSSPYLLPNYFLETKMDLWDAKFRKILRDEEFLPTKNYTCKTCPLSHVHGGSCQY